MPDLRCVIDVVYPICRGIKNNDYILRDIDYYTLLIDKDDFLGIVMSSTKELSSEVHESP